MNWLALGASCQRCVKPLPMGKGYSRGRVVRCFFCGYSNKAETILTQEEFEKERYKLLLNILKEVE